MWTFRYSSYNLIMTRLLTAALALMLTLSLATAPAANWKSLTVTCPTSGAKVVSSTQIKASWVLLQSPYANTGVIYVGDSAVSSTEGVQLLIGDALNAPPQGNSQVFDLGLIYFACSVNTDTVTVLYAQ